MVVWVVHTTHDTKFLQLMHLAWYGRVFCVLTRDTRSLFRRRL
ncbi:MAG: hypothetical protein CM1200mP25_1220 [Acidobacteriota bacterium]|nr:MAG: hypothetical protein CM1200mP25_1220 [Acidobacteriota bacterium]